MAREADRVRVVVVNDAYLLAPWADVHYAADAKWHRWHTQGIEKPLIGLSAAEVRERWAAFAGERCSIQSSAPHVDERVHLLRNKHFPLVQDGEISTDPLLLTTGRNSGFQALNLAILAGARRILLLGYDGAPGADGRAHWHGEHPEVALASQYEAFRRSFSAAERSIEAVGVTVINCSPGSAINSFPKSALEDALEEVAA